MDIPLSKRYSVTVMMCKDIPVSQCHSYDVPGHPSVTVMMCQWTSHCHSITGIMCQDIPVSHHTVMMCQDIPVSQCHSYNVPGHPSVTVMMCQWTSHCHSITVMMCQEIPVSHHTVIMCQDIPVSQL
ncbi:hypothetical protein RRG08_048071 [Elysia crispata]|uniref:Uncharacterized protein n=1 Tax=Elysia crispata TaxID=231223 RepID=A0AAE0Z2Q6_9GAST|nr:hypothetical protein RRG08_048071 [Elysia crispata]